jgi:ech hydrogenase subunit D
MTALIVAETIDRKTLTSRAADLKSAGWRLVQVCCTSKPDHFEVTYSFDKDYVLKNLQIEVLRTDAKIPSLTSHYFCAFTYENELQDLFGLKVEGLALDFGGKFYRTIQPGAFSACATPAAGPSASAPTGRS